MGGALRRALTGGFATTLVVTGLAALPAPPAVAVSTARPIAVAAAADGTSYVGYADGDRLLRLDAHGNPAGSLLLDQDDPVTALDVDGDDDVWVHYGTSVSELSPDGAVLAHFPVRSGGGCPVDRAHDPARYGGLEVTGDAVYVAGRCVATVGIYRHDGDLVASIDLPGTAYPGDVALAPAAKGLPARMYVSQPDTGKVYAYNTSALRSAHPSPVKTLAIKRFFGYRKPAPGPLAADEKGQLAVVDVANNAVHFYNGPESYWYYRTLGHPPDPASDRGFLDRPTAVAYANGSFRKGFWIADTGNGRVQHWDYLGTTDWMTDAVAPGDPGAPVNAELPRITGAPYAGKVLSCDPGTWDAPASYDVAWLRDGLPIPGAHGPDYTVTARDVATALTCVVTARAASGASSAPTASEVFPIPGPHSPPYVLDRPVISGNPQSGSVLRCSNGTWTGGRPSSYLRGWLRDGQLLPGTNAAEYLVTDNDRYHQLTCRVAAVNRNGVGKVALSDPVDVDEGTGGAHLGRPKNSVRPRIVGRAKLGAVLYCDPGRWTNAPVFTYVWRRDGSPLGGSEKDQYEVLGDDLGHHLTCLVTGTNPVGSAQASSKAVRPRR